MIIVGVDGSAAARAAVEWAADDAARTRQPLRLVHAVDRLPYQISRYPGPVQYDALRDAAHKMLREAADLARERQPEVAVSTALVEGSPVVALQDQAKEATEIVLGSRGLGGFTGALLGSVSARVAGQVHCPVVVVRPEYADRRGEIVVGVDDSPECDAALAYAFEQAKLRGATLRAVHAWLLPIHHYAPEIGYDMDEIRQAQHQVVRDKLATIRSAYPEVKVIEDVYAAPTVDALTEASDNATLLVVGSHGRGAVGSVLLGSVSRGVLHHARSAVAVVRA
ncbi:universal stress protein [Nonomuraea sp. NPDC050556]|uniref:universal stress protein n=1 Tax=Nonomuraea sp. NPDC050556 TaxID=3364369 RepID=UPI0037B8E1D4